MADSGVPWCTVAGTNTRVHHRTAACTHTRATFGSYGNTTDTHTHRWTPGNNERSEIRPDINCAHRMWLRLLRPGRCIRAVEGTGRATGLHRSFDVICAIYDTGTSVVDLTSRSSSRRSDRRSRRKRAKSCLYIIVV